MKKICFLLLFLCSGIFAHAQSTPETKESPLTITDQMPVFPGGDEKMQEYIQKNVNYPKAARNANISGTCYVTFVVEQDGSISNVAVLRGVTNGADCDAEAIRVVQAMPKWIPGKQDGKEVRVQYNLPIKFTLRTRKNRKK